MDNTEKLSPLARRRKALRLSQAQLAERLGVTQATVSRNETCANPDRRYCLALEAIEMQEARAA